MDRVASFSQTEFVWRMNGRFRCVIAIGLIAGLLAKIALNVRLIHYGFALAMPATLCLTAIILLQEIPRWIQRRGERAPRSSSARRWPCGCRNVWSLYLDHVSSAADRFIVGDGGRFVPGAGAGQVQLMIQAIGQRLPPDGTLAVMPQGLMLNYLMRRTNPTPYVNFMPPEVLAVGERQYWGALLAIRRMELCWWRKPA